MKLSSRDKDILRKILRDLPVTPRPKAGAMNKAGALKFQHITVSLPPDLVVRVRGAGINISATVEKLLRFYLNVIND